MRPPLHGTILITGASSGIGKALAEQLAGDAARLILVARRRDRLDALATTLRARHPGCDVRVRTADLADPDAIDALVDTLDVAIDVLIANAGQGDVGLFECSDPEWLHAMLMVNVVGLTRLTRALVPGMVARGRGGVLLVSSGYGLTWMPGTAAYVGTKHYVSALAECLRSEVASAGVVVTQLCPGPVDTEFEERAGTFFAGRPPPRFLFLSAERVAADAIAGFARGRAIVIPGRLMKLVIPLGAWTPRWVLRLVYAPFARMLRAESRRTGVTARSASG